MDYKTVTEELKKMIDLALEEEGVELVEFNLVRTGNTSLLRLLVDIKGGGINIADCARINHKVGNLLELSNILEEKYVLEVSSPGLDRPLKNKSDFSRVINKKVKFFLNQAINGRIELDAVVVQVEPDAVGVEVEGKILQIPLSVITKAKLFI